MMNSKASDKQSKTTAAGDDFALLDIHQAASFLSVSEVSVRRYTNSGALRCVRVGGRRQRRFRRKDLEAFVGLKPSDQSEFAPVAGVNSDCVNLEGLEVAWGSHLCQLYETDRGRTQMAVPFLADGLAAGHACFLIASDPVRANLLGALEELHGALQDDIEAGRLQFVDPAGSGDAMLTALDDAFSTAMKSGFARLRLVGDMAWFPDQGLSGDELVSFESRYDSQIGHSYPVVSLCLYDARRFSGIGVLHALKSHADTFEQPLSRFLLR